VNAAPLVLFTEETGTVAMDGDQKEWRAMDRRVWRSLNEREQPRMRRRGEPGRAVSIPISGILSRCDSSATVHIIHPCVMFKLSA
jgi:hypothetical protein